MSEPKQPITHTVGETPGPGPTTESAAAQKRIDAIRAKNNRAMAQRLAAIGNKSTWIEHVRGAQAKDPQFLKYLREHYPKQVAEAERAIAAGKPASTPKVVPRIGSPKLGGFRAGMRAGFAGAFSAANLASMIPEIILAVADRAAVKDAIRNIQTKYLREGFARGFAAGVMRWTDEEVQSNLKHHVREADLQAMHDPAGFLKRADMFHLAENCESYAVDVGFDYSSRQSTDWKTSMLKKGFSMLLERGYTKWQRADDPAVLFEFDFIDKLAWVLRSTTDTLVIIRFS